MKITSCKDVLTHMHIFLICIWDGPYENTRMGFPYAYWPIPYVYGTPIRRMGQRLITCIEEKYTS